MQLKKKVLLRAGYKGGKMRYVLAIAIMLSLSFGLVTESFRYQSTAFLWEDDYDLLFDPARIPEIDGARLWTGLSNFVTGNEQVFADSGAPFFYIGGMMNYGKYYPGFVYNRQVTKEALPTGLYDPMEGPILGYGEVITIDWTLDPDGDPDYASVEKRTASAYNAIKNNDFYVAVGTHTNDLRFGLGFMRQYHKNILTDPVDNFTTEFFNEDYPSNDTTYWRKAQSAGDYIYSDTDNDILLSGWMDQDDYSIGLMVVYGMLSRDEEGIITGSDSTLTDPSDPTSDFTEITRIDSGVIPQSGTRLGAELKLFYNYNEDAQGRYYFGYSTESYDYDEDAMNWSYYASAAEYSDFTYDTITNVTYYDGDMSHSCLTAGTKQLFHINDRFRFGLGLFFSITSMSADSLTMQENTTNIEVYDDGDGVDDIDDYRREETFSQTWMDKIDGNTKTFTIPVGAEFNISDPLVFRLGAQYTLDYNDITTTRALIDYQPTTTEWSFGDGTDTTLVDQDYTEDGWQVTDESTVSSTDYFYGIGWQVNDNLQIDLMHFNEIDNLYSWRLSATVKFD